MTGQHAGVAVRLIVTGRVQGVGFRYFTRRCADSLGVKGRVRNLADGTVEVEAGGSPEVLAELKRKLRQGPPGSRVTALDETPLGRMPERDGFEITY